MTSHVLHFVELGDAHREATGSFGNLGDLDQVEIHIKRGGGEDQILSLPRRPRFCWTLCLAICPGANASRSLRRIRN